MTKKKILIKAERKQRAPVLLKRIMMLTHTPLFHYSVALQCALLEEGIPVQLLHF